VVILESLRERILTHEHHATVAAYPGMNRVYYAMRHRCYWSSKVTEIYDTISKCTTCAREQSLTPTSHVTPVIVPG